MNDYHDSPYWKEYLASLEDVTVSGVMGFCEYLLDRLAAADGLAEAAQEAKDWLDNAPFDYSNGNLSNDGTIDEGNFYGHKGHNEVTAKLRAALAAYRAGK